jgi:RAD50-interacting protein 1
VQLDDADRDARSAAENASKHSQEHAGRSKTWEHRQKEIDRRIQAITQSTTSDEAVKKFEPILQKLQHLDLAVGVVETLLEIEQLRYGA